MAAATQNQDLTLDLFLRIDRLLAVAEEVRAIRDRLIEAARHLPAQNLSQNVAKGAPLKGVQHAS